MTKAPSISMHWATIPPKVIDMTRIIFFHPFFKSGFKLRKMDLGFLCDLFPCVRQMRGCHQGLVEKSKEILPGAQEHCLVFILAAVPLPSTPQHPSCSIHFCILQVPRDKSLQVCRTGFQSFTQQHLLCFSKVLS